MESCPVLYCNCKVWFLVLFYDFKFSLNACISCLHMKGFILCGVRFLLFCWYDKFTINIVLPQINISKIISVGKDCEFGVKLKLW
jgi:hypothetical protein